MADGSISCEVAVVGGGPAGLAAACTAAESGRRVVLLDESPWLGGQIWRGEQNAAAHPHASAWFARFDRSGAKVLARSTVISSPAPGSLLAEQDGEGFQVKWDRLILATGARELFLPFPGWTLPGVMGPGGLQSLIKNGWPVSGQRVVVAGSGPLLLAVADTLRKHGANVRMIAEQASWSSVIRFGLGLAAHTSKLLQAALLKLRLLGIQNRYGAWPVSAEGKDRIQMVTLTDGAETWKLDCDLLACGFGLVPNLELAMALGCELKDGFVRVNDLQATSIPNVFCAGEPTGIGGADCALVEGQIAGYASAEFKAQAERLFAKRRSWHTFRTALAEAFALRPVLKNLATNETIICRCEDVSLGRLRQCTHWREAKLHSRCGMGACQGRVCGAAAKFILGWEPESIRPPVLPARVGSLISSRSEKSGGHFR